MHEILRIADVLKITRISRTTLWRYIRNKDFPAPIKLGGQRSRCVGWYAKEVNQWLEDRPRATSNDTS